ncbi:MAG: lysophospholipid acyltransferase family protein [Elusimicrobiota bacterium]|nr:lysophospholipid acyltransferase family protein [Elusimicrobiota bacterium]
MRLVRVLWKGGLLAAHIALGAAAGALLALGPGSRLRRGLRVDERFMRWWSRTACSILRLRVRRAGAPPAPASLLVANHVSWLEVVALSSVTPCGFVAKSEVARWPVIGALASSAGTLFLRRGSSVSAAAATQEAVLRLASGRSVAVFPEGTSTDGESVLPFKASFFDAAARLGCEVQPVAVFYPRGAGDPAVAPFIGDDEFFPHLLRVLAEPEIVVQLRFAAPVCGHGRERGELAGSARAAVLDALDQERRALQLLPDCAPHESPWWWEGDMHGSFLRAEFRRVRPPDLELAFAQDLRP